MKRWASVAGLVLVAGLAIGLAQRQETFSEETTEEPGPGTHGTLELWKWANFALLAGGLGWVIKKNAGPFFAARSREIRKQMVEAEDIHAEAERRSAEVEQRLANLAAEIAALREEAIAEQKAESERFAREIEAEIAKVEQQAAQEIDAAGKQARLELQRYTAELALGAAEVKIRARMTSQAQGALVDAFVRGLEPPGTPAQGM